MSKKHRKEKRNPLDEQMEELNEWQENATNPGHYTGSGKIPAPMKNLTKSPLILLIMGMAILIPEIFNLIQNFNVLSILPHLLIITGSGVLIVGGILRIIKKY